MSSEGLESTKVRHRVDTSYFGGPSSGFNSSLGRLDCHLLHPRPASFRHKPSASRIFGADIYIYIYILIYISLITRPNKKLKNLMRDQFWAYSVPQMLSHFYRTFFATGSLLGLCGWTGVFPLQWSSAQSFHFHSTAESVAASGGISLGFPI